MSPSFAAGKRGRGVLRRFRVRIHAVDSSVLELVANCMDWAKHRRRKAAAKMHLRLDLHSFLPSFAIVDTAGEHDNRRAQELCAGVAQGEVVVFDKAYIDFDHLRDLVVGEGLLAAARGGSCERLVRGATWGAMGGPVWAGVMRCAGRSNNR